MSTLPIQPYSPFPPFEEFSSTEFDTTAFTEYERQMASAKADATAERLKAAIERATRFAAVDTGAIEGLYEVDRGFTLSVATEAAAWDNIHLAKGEKVAQYINDALRGYEHVMDVATGSRPITEKEIREVHAVLCASQTAYTVITELGLQEHGLPKGEYKVYPNNPMNVATGVVHSYASVEDTPAEMMRLIGELGTESFIAAHPVLQAAYAHYAFVCIHPFADGNGRVARAMASVFLYRSPGVPLVIFADQKPAYLDSLELADAGDYRAFVKFIGDRAADAVKMLTTDLLRAIPADVRADRIAVLQASLLGRGGLPHSEVDRLGSAMIREFFNACRDANVTPVLPPVEIAVEFQTNVQMDLRMSDLRPISHPGAVLIRGSLAAPANVTRQVMIGPMAARQEVSGYDFALVQSDRVVATFELRDFSPTTTAAATYTLQAIAEAVLWNVASEVADEGVGALRQRGYAN